MDRNVNEAKITFVAYWDSDDSGRGPFVEVEVQTSPEWMSSETIRKIEQDIADHMHRNKHGKR